MSADDYYAAMDMGKFAGMSHEQLDKIAQGLCGDMKRMKPDERKLAVIVIRDSTDTELEASQAGRAMASRWCPEFVDVFAW